jgi:hypothetical protein
MFAVLESFRLCEPVFKPVEGIRSFRPTGDRRCLNPVACAAREHPIIEPVRPKFDTRQCHLRQASRATRLLKSDRRQVSQLQSHGSAPPKPVKKKHYIHCTGQKWSHNLRQVPIKIQAYRGGSSVTHIRKTFGMPSKNGVRPDKPEAKK